MMDDGYKQWIFLIWMKGNTKEIPWVTACGYYLDLSIELCWLIPRFYPSECQPLVEMVLVTVQSTFYWRTSNKYQFTDHLLHWCHSHQLPRHQSHCSESSNHQPLASHATQDLDRPYHMCDLVQMNQYPLFQNHQYLYHYEKPNISYDHSTRGS